MLQKKSGVTFLEYTEPLFFLFVRGEKSSERYSVFWVRKIELLEILPAKTPSITILRQAKGH